MTIRAFNSIQGFSVGENPTQNIILANGDITTVNFTANGVSNLGPIGNVKITGGTAGQSITTDGSGNLVFSTTMSNSAAPMPYYIPTGESYIVPANFQGLFSLPIEIDGELVVNGALVEVISIHNSNVTEIVFNDGNGYTSNAGFTFEKLSGNLNVPGGILTDHYYYANGAPFTPGGNAAGSNNQIQFNNANAFGASANFTFSTDTNILQVTGNISATNANVGNTVSANYLIASEGCVSISTSTIQVSGADAGIFNINVSNLNVGLAASNLTFGSIASNSTFRGNLVSNSYSTTGTVTTSNIKANKITGNGNSVLVITDTVIDSFAIADYRSAKYTIRAGSDIGYQAIEVLLIHDDINSIVTVYGSLSTAGVDLVTLSTQIVSGNVELSATALTANTNVNLIGIYVSD